MGESVSINLSTPADPANQPETPNGIKPDTGGGLILGKYKNYGELEKAHKELEAKLGQPKGEEPPKEPQDEAGNPDNSKSTEEPTAEGLESLTAKKAESIPTLDMKVFNEEFAKEGKLSDKSYEKLGKLGIGKDVVDAYIEGQKVIAQRTTQEVYDLAGGKEEFEKVHAWLGTPEVTEEQREAYNKALLGSNRAERLQAVKAAVASYREVNGFEGEMIGGRAPKGEPGYESGAQMLADIQNPKYAQDPAFRDMVDRKLAKSPHLWKK